MILESAQETKSSPAEVALRWVLEQTAITAAIIGARTTEQLRDNLHAADERLDAALLARLNQVSRQPDRYPQAMERDAHLRRNQAIKMPSLGASK